MIANVAQWATLLMAATTVSALDGFPYLSSTDCDPNDTTVTKLPDVPINRCITITDTASDAPSVDPNNGVRFPMLSFEFAGVQGVCPEGSSPNAYMFANSLTCNGDDFFFNQPFDSSIQNPCMRTGSEFRSIMFVCCRGDPSVAANCAFVG